LAPGRGRQRRRDSQRAPGSNASLTDAIVTAIDHRTAVVAVAQCPLDRRLPGRLARIGEAARRHGAALVVDASQSLGACPLNVENFQPDFLVSVGYKWLLGPYGLGYLYVAERWHAQGSHSRNPGCIVQEATSSRAW